MYICTEADKYTFLVKFLFIPSLYVCLWEYIFYRASFEVGRFWSVELTNCRLVSVGVVAFILSVQIVSLLICVLVSFFFFSFHVFVPHFTLTKGIVLTGFYFCVHCFSVLFGWGRVGGGGGKGDVQPFLLSYFFLMYSYIIC